MENDPSRYAIVIHPKGYDAAKLVARLTASRIIPVHVMSYDEWADTERGKGYDLFFLRNDGSWRFLSGSEGSNIIATEIRELSQLDRVEGI